MNHKFLRILVFSSVMMMSGALFSAVQTMTDGLRGTGLIGLAKITVADQQFDFMLNHQSTYQDYFHNNSSKVNVRLHYDQSNLQQYYSAYWKCVVVYTIDIYSATGSSHQYTGQTMTVEYDPTGKYNTEVVSNYADGGYKAILTVNSVTFYNSNNQVISMTVPEDLMLDVEVETDRSYLIDTFGTPDVALGVTASQEAGSVAITWPFVYGAENYDVEWLFLDIPDLNSIAQNEYEVDFNNAYRINTNHNWFRIPLGYSSGAVVFRIRASGEYGSSYYLTMEQSFWSYIPTGVTYIEDVPTEFVYYFQGLEEGMNWQYSASFTEQGKHQEQIQYMDGLGNVRQSIGFVNGKEKKAVVGEAIYDYNGRVAAEILPSVTKNNGLEFYNSYNHNFGKSNIDGDVKLYSPDAMNTAYGSGNFYSDDNTSQKLLDKWLPDAGGYPYRRTIYRSDGTGRVRGSYLAGTDFKSGSGHGVTVYSSSADQWTLDKLFGNEAGTAENYHRQIMVDGNGQISYSIIDLHGRVVATSIDAGNADSLLPVDNTPAIETTNNDLMPLNEVANNASVTTYQFFASTPGQVFHFGYFLMGKSGTVECMPGSIDAKYDVSLCVYNEYGDSVDINTTSSELFGYHYYNYDQQTLEFEFSPTDVGEYTIVKRVTLNDTQINWIEDNFESLQTCVEMPEVMPAPCLFDCEEVCREQFVLGLDENGDTIYVDDNGDVISSATANSLISACIAESCGVQPILDESPCDFKRRVMKADMSPGGQYFDNMPARFVPDGNGGVAINPHYYTETTGYETEYVDYMMGYIDGQSSIDILNNVINATAQHGPYSTWSEVRNAWDIEKPSLSPFWDELLLPFHPEYCQYEQQCLEGCSGDVMSMSDDYLMGMINCSDDVTASSEGYFNPLGLTPDCISKGIDGDNQHYVCFENPNIPIETDPLADCKEEYCNGYTYSETLSEYMSKYYYEPLNGVYYSIWYVINDPDKIAEGGKNVDPATTAFFQALHGITPNSGLIGTGAGQMSKYVFFRSAYQFFREYMMYNTGKNNCQSGLFEIDDYGITSSPAVYAGMQARFGKNPIFEALGYSCPPEFGLDLLSNYTTNPPFTESATCETNCENSSAAWMDQLSGCTLQNGYTAQQVHDWLVEICTNSCTADNGFQGDDESNVGVGPALDWYTFEDVVSNCYESGCEIPAHGSSGYSQAECSCEIIMGIYVDQGEDALATANEINDLYDADFKEQDVINWITECSQSGPSMDDLLSFGYPQELSCADGEDIYGSSQTLAELIAECEAQHQAEADFQEQMIFDQLLEQQLPLTIDAYHEMAMNDIESREFFAVYYNSNEFLYTLYYYDQAGNLVRTVPPEGIQPVPVLDMYKVQQHRDNPSTYAAVYPSHSMVTSYEYNSYQLVTEQTIPDGMKENPQSSGIYEFGSTTKYYYDDKGRIIVSQNYKQQTADASGNRRYSYTLYDDIGRIKETGEASLYDDPAVIGQETDPYDETRSFMVYKDDDATTDDYYTTWYSTISTGSLSQVMRTWYDESLSGIGVQFGTSGQENIRNRVCSVTKDEDNDGNYESAIHYSYDVHGNAKTVLRDIPELYYIGKQFFRMDYEYELLSGNVKKLTYQDGEYDQFIHRYSYDANNRLRSVSTSSDGFVWTQDAKQLYNSIGTMARLELGQYQVQGLDYIYTINGWLKAINSVTLKVDRDPGHDGVERSLYLGSNNPHAFFAQDAFGFALTYFKQKPDEVVICNNTYSADNAGFEPTIDQGCSYGNAVYDLYNGNIASWSSGLLNADESRMDVQSYVFRYDKLNRIKTANAWTETNIVVSNKWDATSSQISGYQTSYTYDYNGNILSLLRKGQTSNPNMDNLTYGYFTNGQSGSATRRRTNMLLGYNDAVGSGAYTDTDIDDPGLGTFSESSSATWNFIYDEVGNLIRDKAEEIDNIEWNVYGKVKKVTRFSTSPASNKPDLEFVYDPMGNRICKIEKPRTAGVLSTQEDWKYTWYSLDAQGQTMAAYEQTYTDQGSGSYVLNFDHQETYIYGSSRVGVVNDEQDEIESTRGFTASIDGNTGKFINVVWNNPTMHLNCTEYCVNVYTRTVGMRQYELSNHLGNVQTTISDRRIAVSSGSNLDYYIADVISSTDYYPFGSPMPGRNSNSADYRFGFNGKEKIDELFESSGSAYDFGARLYDSRLGRWMACDPFSKFAANWTPYHYCMNSPVCMVDIDGKWNVIYIYIAKEFTDGYTGKKIILTDEEITAIQNKIVAAFNRTDICFNSEIAFVSEPMETEYLDQTDVTIQITSIHDLNEFVGTPDGSENITYEYISGICGSTPKDVELPIGVFLGGFNVPDYVAYYTMHEICHRISKLVYTRYSHVNYLAFPEELSEECKKKWNCMSGEDHDYNEGNKNLLSPGFDMKETFGSKPLEDWNQEYFNLSKERRDLLFKAYGNRNNPPTDNASKRKSEKTGKKSTVIRRVPRKKNEPRSKF